MGDGKEKRVCASNRLGKRAFWHLCSLWAAAEKGHGEGVWHQRHFWFPFKAESQGRNQLKAAAPKAPLLLSALLGRFPPAACRAGCAFLEEWDGHKFMYRLTVKLSVLE